MMPPHWIDNIIGEERDPAVIAKAFASSPKLLHIINVGVDQARLAEDQKEGTHVAGASFGHIVREAIIKGVQNDKGNVPVDG